MSAKISNTIWQRVFRHRTVSRDRGTVRRSINSASTLGIIIRHPSWPETGELIETLRFPASSMTAPQKFQDTIKSPSWCQAGSLNHMPKDQPKLWYSAGQN